MVLYCSAYVPNLKSSLKSKFLDVKSVTVYEDPVSYSGMNKCLENECSSNKYAVKWNSATTRVLSRHGMKNNKAFSERN